MTEKPRRDLQKFEPPSITPTLASQQELDRILEIASGDSRPEAFLVKQAFSILRNYGVPKVTPSGDRYTISLGSTIVETAGKKQELRLIKFESSNQDVEHIDNGVYLTVGETDGREIAKFDEDTEIGLRYVDIIGNNLEWRKTNPLLQRQIDHVLNEIETDSERKYPEWKKQQDKIKAKEDAEKQDVIAEGVAASVVVILIGSLVYAMCNSESTSQQDIADVFDAKNLVIDLDTTLKIGTSGIPTFAYELLNEEFADGKVPELERCDYYYNGDCTYYSDEYDLDGVFEPADIDQLRKIDLRPNEPELYKVRFDSDSDSLKALTVWPVMEEITIEVGQGYLRATWNPSEATMNSPEYSENSQVNVFVQRQPAPEQ